jgi:hypothetical protein
VPTQDLSGIGAMVTAQCAKQLRNKCVDARRRRLTSAVGLTTVVAWTRFPRASDKGKPWHNYPASSTLGREDCEITLVPDGAQWRAVCSGHNCGRDLLPCSGLLCLYPGKLHLDDVHPRWRLKDLANVIDEVTQVSHAYRGLAVSAERKDCMGATPSQRVAYRGDLWAAAKTLSAPAGEPDPSSDESDEEHTEMELADLPADRANGVTPTTHLELTTTADTFVRMASRNPTLRQIGVEYLLIGIERLRQTTEQPHDSGSPCTRQTRDHTTGRTSASVRLGSRPRRRLVPA